MSNRQRDQQAKAVVDTRQAPWAAGLAAAYLPPDAAEGVCRRLSVLGWALKSEMWGVTEDDYLDAMLPSPDAAEVKAARKRPIALLRGARRDVAQAAAAGFEAARR